MTVNLHTHTFRCGHASGTERDYIEAARSVGITHMGFSDHVPFVFPDGHESKFRVPMAQAQSYMDTLRSLREEYRNKMEILIGFEMEYYPRYFESMLQTVNDLGADYLLLGQHFIDNEDFPEASTFKPFSENARLASYVNTVIEAMETGVFTYVAHPDVIHFCGDNRVYETEMRRLCAASTRLALPLEINFLGIRDHRNYPNSDFWRIAGAEGCPVVFGFDAHDVRGACDDRSLSTATHLAEQYGLTVVSYPTLIHPLTGKRTPLLPRK